MARQVYKQVINEHKMLRIKTHELAKSASSLLDQDNAEIIRCTVC